MEFNDDGHISVTLRSAGGSEATRTLPLFETFLVLSEIGRRSEGKGPMEFERDVQVWLTEQGFPYVSLKCAGDFAAAITAASVEVKKNQAASASAGSSGSTGPLPAASRPMSN